MLFAQYPIVRCSFNIQIGTVKPCAATIRTMVDEQDVMAFERLIT